MAIHRMWRVANRLDNAAMKPNLAFKQDILLPKGLKAVLQKAKKVNVTLCHPPIKCHILFVWPAPFYMSDNPILSVLSIVYLSI